MDLFKWTKSLKPKFPNVVEKFFGKKIDDQVSDTEVIASVPSVNISDKGKTFEAYLPLALLYLLLTWPLSHLTGRLEKGIRNGSTFRQR